jgi:two-component system chemotaxis response regulator CheY
LKFNLESHGYETETASDCYEALEALNAADNGFHLILTDLHMPNMNGLELIEKIRTDESHRFLPILFLTTETNPEMKQRASKAGATGWIVKPFAPEQLIKTVRKVLR